MSSHLNSAQTRPQPDPEVVARPQRRLFTAEYKAKILAECDSASESGQIGAILRREGLYSSSLVDWRRSRAGGLVPKKPGRPAKSIEQQAAEGEVERLRRENAALVEQLRCAEVIIEAQKKLSLSLASLHSATKNV